MLPDDTQLKKILIAGGYVKERQIKRGEYYATPKYPTFVEYLLGTKIITKQQLGEAIGKHLGFYFADLDKYAPQQEIAELIPRDVAEDFRVILLKITVDKAYFGSDTPDEERLEAKLKEFFPKHKIVVYYSLPEQIEESLKLYRKILKTSFSNIGGQGSEDIPRLFDALVKDAVKFNASDVHMEPRLRSTLVRFRVDGELEEAGKISSENYERLLNFLKTKNEMRTDLHMIAQDGSMQYRIDRQVFDIRTSIAPTIDGQKTVLRILSAYVRVLSLDELGLTGEYQTALVNAIRKPFGMVVISGPTGSGKTTTLYALLKSLNRTSVNITTIEDPVEYRIPGVNQVQVNPEAKLTFAKGLRALVRQDPNVILVGEIRDSETAEIAMNAALTGILVFSTFHAGDSAITIPRLVDMGIEPFIIASALELIMSQRLLRKICPHCKKEYKQNLDELKTSLRNPSKYLKEGEILYKGEGCEKCDHSGYKGRVAIFESITMTPEMRDLTVKRPSSQDVWKLASKQGSKSLFDDGLVKVREGQTTIDELLRIAQPWDT